VAGRVVRVVDSAEVALPGAWAVLHRVGPDGAGPLDSVRTGADGGYAFRYRATGSDRAVYFVSASHHGIAYFTAPLRGAAVEGEPATIAVYDTVHAAPLAVRGRHVIVQRLDDAARRAVTEVYDVENAGTRTLVPRDSSTPTFAFPLPTGARDPTAGRGDVSGAAMRFTDGRADVFAPFAPGVRQVVVQYTLAASDFPLRLAVRDALPVLEVLLEDSTATAKAAGLAEAQAVTVEGRNFKRWLGNDVVAGTPLVLALAPSEIAPGTLIGLVLGGAVLLIAVAFAAQRRRPSAALPGVALPSAPTPSRLAGVGTSALAAARLDATEQLARAIANLDRAFEKRRDPSPDERAAYQQQRAELKAQLTAALAERVDAR
jgi:hypothetical protein